MVELQPSVFRIDFVSRESASSFEQQHRGGFVTSQRLTANCSVLTANCQGLRGEDISASGCIISGSVQKSLQRRMKERVALAWCGPSLQRRAEGKGEWLWSGPRLRLDKRVQREKKNGFGRAPDYGYTEESRKRGRVASLMCLNHVWAVGWIAGNNKVTKKS